MASIASTSPQPQGIAPDRYERLLAVASVILIAVVLMAIWRGHGQWGQVPNLVWFHLLTILVALALTPVMLLRRRGDRRHRWMGWVWSGALFLTALDSFLLHGPGSRFSIIHILSIFTLIQVPIIVLSARRHDLKRHRRSVRGMVTGALLIAGFFTFPFDRMLGHWLFG
jgi:uncharacterized membrane protein